MTISTQFEYDRATLDAIANRGRKTPDLFKALARRTGDARQNARAKTILRKLKQTPGKPKYPLRWESDRQRKFVMRKLRREGNLPYRRTGRLNDAWVVNANIQARTGEITIENDTPYAVYVVGDAQQPFHQDTGWQTVGDVLEEGVNDLVGELAEAWYAATGVIGTEF